MEDLLGIKNINCHSEQCEESHNVIPMKIKNNRLLVANFPVRRAPLSIRERARVRGQLLTLPDKEIAEQVRNDRDKCAVTPPEFLSSQSSLRNSALPVQGGRKFAKAGFTLAEGATHVGLPPVIAKTGFTLAEVLITLGIIGVVAAMTIPNLMTGYKAHQLKSQFLKSYSTIQQVFKHMEYDELSLNPSDYSAGTFYKTFANYLKGATLCINGSGVVGCYNRVSDAESDDYKGINVFYLDDGMILLADGSLLLFENTVKTANESVMISVDLNGYLKGPNIAGYDLFTFQLVEEKLLPMGARGTDYDLSSNSDYCNFSKISSGVRNSGISCAQKAVTDTDYFKNAIKKIK